MPAREEVAAEMTGQTKPSELSPREQRWSWVKGDSRASRFGSSGTRGQRSPRSPGTETISSMSSGMRSPADQILSP